MKFSLGERKRAHLTRCNLLGNSRSHRADRDSLRNCRRFRGSRFLKLTVFGFTILWIVESSLYGAFWVREHRLLLPLCTLVVFAAIQSLTLGKAVAPAVAGGSVSRALSADPFETWRFALKLLAITLTLGMLLRYTTSVERLRILVFVVVGVALASAVFGLLRPDIPGSWLSFAETHLKADGSFGQFGNRNHFALLMELAIGLVLGPRCSTPHLSQAAAACPVPGIHTLDCFCC